MNANEDGLGLCTQGGKGGAVFVPPHHLCRGMGSSKMRLAEEREAIPRWIVEVEVPIPFARRKAVRLPLFSAKVQAGFPSPADDHLEKSIDLNEELVRHPASTFFVRVKGDSMRDAGIQTGDILVVDRSLPPSDRKIVVAMVDGEFTVKRFRQAGGKVFLEAANENFPRIELFGNQELVVWGVVAFIIHPAR